MLVVSGRDVKSFEDMFRSQRLHVAGLQNVFEVSQSHWRERHPVFAAVQSQKSVLMDIDNERVGKATSLLTPLVSFVCSNTAGDNVSVPSWLQ